MNYIERVGCCCRYLHSSLFLNHNTLGTRNANTQSKSSHSQPLIEQRSCNSCLRLMRSVNNSLPGSKSTRHLEVRVTSWVMCKEGRSFWVCLLEEDGAGPNEKDCAPTTLVLRQVLVDSQCEQSQLATYGLEKVLQILMYNRCKRGIK